MLTKLIYVLIGIFAVYSQALGQAKKVTPANDPPGQLFRHAPMPKATRTVVIPLGDIQFAFDTENLRPHTVWRGKLDLYGPQYAHAKRPFISQPNGKLLLENPPSLPWRLAKPEPKFDTTSPGIEGRFLSTSTEGNTVTLRYELLQNDHPPVEVSITLEATADGFTRTINLSPCNRSLWFLANRFPVGSDHDFRLNTEDQSISSRMILSQLDYTELNITEAGAESTFDKSTTNTEANLHWVHIPSHDKPVTFQVMNSFPALNIPDVENEKRLQLGNIGTTQFGPRPGKKPPHYFVESLRLDKDWELLVTGMDWLEDGRLAVCTWPGDVFLLSGVTSGDDVRVRRLLSGLNEPMGLLVRDGKLYVSQKPELTEISFDDEKGSVALRRVSADWGYSGHYNAFSYGPVADRNNRFVLANAGHSGRWDMKFMGWGIRQGVGGTMTGIGSGFREPNGIGTFGQNRDIFVTDNQGHWTAVCELNHLRPGQYFGRPSATPDPQKLYKGRDNFTPPAVWFPYTLAKSVSGMAEITNDKFGPYKEQLIVGDFQNALLTRVFLEKVDGEYQGVVFPFLRGFRSGVNRLSFGPDGNLYVGGLQRTWACIAPDPASLERVSFNGNAPFSIAKVEAKPDGFLLTFTKPAKPSAANPDNFDVSQFRYAYQPGYGSPRYNFQGKKNSQTGLHVKSATLSSDRKSVRLVVDGLKEEHVTEFKCYDIVDNEGNELWHILFHYTLNRIPRS